MGRECRELCSGTAELEVLLKQKHLSEEDAAVYTDGSVCREDRSAWASQPETSETSSALPPNTP